LQAIQAHGYTGSSRRVTASVSRIRQAQGIPPRRQRQRQRQPMVAEPVSQPLTPRRALWLVLRRAEQRPEVEAQPLAQLHAPAAEVAAAIDRAQDFPHLVRQRQPERLDAWLTRAPSRTLEALQRCASGLREDDEAVKAGVTLPGSTSPVEGHINRLNMVQRQMLGRAHLALVRCRFLRVPRGDQAQGLGQQTPTQAPAGAA
jgi:transposase